MKNQLLLLVLIFTTATGIASPKPIPPIITKILSIKGPVIIFNRSNDQWFQIKDLPIEFSQFRSGQQILKTDEGIFLTVPGTGRLYKAIVATNTIDFVRVDSTHFSGINFSRLSFNIGNEIYNFGGNGFWAVNGYLRHYDKKMKEWYLVELNRFLPWFNTQNKISYLNENNGKLYVQGVNSNPHITKNKTVDTLLEKTLFELDIKTGDWKELGLLNFNSDYTLFAHSPFGILTRYGIFDVEHNLHYKHNYDVDLVKLYRSNSSSELSISFCVDSTIYFGNAEGRFDSLIISRTQLSPIGPLYTPKSKRRLFTAVNISILWLLLCCITILALYLKKQSKKPAKIELEAVSLQVEKDNSQTVDKPKKQDELINPMVYKSGKLVELLSNQEKDFLSYIYRHSLEERLTTLVEINKALGTSNKTVEIQKRVRGEIINGINEKLSIITKVKRPVIDKVRSDFDKRTFEYFIQKEHFELVNNILSI